MRGLHGGWHVLVDTIVKFRLKVVEEVCLKEEEVLLGMLGLSR
jgi:hypothetical protein